MRAHASIISFATAHHLGGPAIPLVSEPLAIEITPPNDQDRQARLAKASEILQGASPATTTAVNTAEAIRNREARVSAARDLRWMIDQRAIPVLVRGLSDSWPNVAFACHQALRSFRDLASVRAALLGVVNGDQTIPPTTRSSFLDLLTRSELQVRGQLAEPFNEQTNQASQEIRKRWSAVLSRKTGAHLP